MRKGTLALTLVVALGISCSSASEDAPAPAAAASVQTASVAGEEVKKQPASRPRGRPLPAFSGYTLDDEKVSVSDLVGKRLLIYFFNPEVKKAETMTRAVNAIAPLRGAHNFEILGIATGSSRATARAYVDRLRIPFRVLDDSSAQLARRFGLQMPVALLGTDAEGYVNFGLAGVYSDDPKAIEANLRKGLRLPEENVANGSGRPQAPDFTARRLGGGDDFAFAELQGKPTVLIFFLHTCPHCHSGLRFLREALAELPEEKRPELVGIEISGRDYAVREMLKQEKLDFFPVLFDDDGSTQSAYGVFGGVPDILLIDAEGRIASRTSGWSDDRHPALLRMRLAALAGTPVPMLLRKTGYSGSEVCGVCHSDQHETWSFTTHAGAYDTLVKHGAENDTECVGCHVVGYTESGGFVDAQATPDLEDVGCESCHGRGGPHQSPDFLAQGGYAGMCVTCHDTKHSLGFDYATFVPRVSHAANAELLALSPEEKAKILAARGRPGGDLLPTNAEYTGSEACRSCHAAEFQTWEASPHAHAGKTLEAKGKAGDADCLRCHTTAYDRPGGFPTTARLSAETDLGRVGCESCHGPGGEHVKEGVAKLGSIVSLGDKCDSCVILQICGSCHDDANDPGFEFEVQEKIDRQRHGTIEAGTGKPKEKTASRWQDAATLARAFARADGAATER